MLLSVSLILYQLSFEHLSASVHPDFQMIFCFGFVICSYKVEREILVLIKIVNCGYAFICTINCTLLILTELLLLSLIVFSDIMILYRANAHKNINDICISVIS